jgi:hypothetical protein
MMMGDLRRGGALYVSLAIRSDKAVVIGPSRATELEIWARPWSLARESHFEEQGVTSVKCRGCDADVPRKFWGGRRNYECACGRPDRARIVVVPWWKRLWWRLR